jgi:hypothetical protein
MRILTESGQVVTDEETVAVGKATLLRALVKARRLYIASCASNGHDPGPDHECWAEFERLAARVTKARQEANDGE